MVFPNVVILVCFAEFELFDLSLGNNDFKHMEGNVAPLIQSSPLTVASSGQEKSVTVSKCHSKHMVLIYERPFGNCQNCHCKRGVTLTGVTVSGEVCKTKYMDSVP